MVHTSYGEVGDFEPANLGDNGCVFKNATFLGKSAHAGFAPDRGINALYAANLAMNAINALRETFREADYIRTHPIITGGGSVVNAIPSVVTVENQVRAANMESLVATNEKINRAMAGAAAAMGDISCLMPAIHPYCRGAAGPAHSDDYRIASVEKAFLYDDPVSTADYATVIEVYYHKHQKGRKTLHYCKFVGDHVLFATENETEEFHAIDGSRKPSLAEAGLYDHGMFPYVLDPLFPIEGSPCGYGYVDLCRNPQTEIDIMKTSFVKNAMVGSIPRYFAQENGNVKAEDFLDLSRPLIPVSGSIDESSLRRVEHTSLDGNYLNLLQQDINELRETSGNTETATGTANSGVTAASAIAALQEASGKGSRDSTQSSYRAFAQIAELCVELIRQFYDLPRQFRIVGQFGVEDYISYTNKGLRPQQQMLMGKAMGMRKPVFDIKISAQRKNVFTTVSQNELALQFYKLGFFNPNMAEQAIMCLKMMEFDCKDIIMQDIRQNAMLVQKLQQYMQMSLSMAQIMDPAAAQSIAMDISQTLGKMPGIPAMAGAAPKLVQSDNIRGIQKEEPAVVANARERSANASQPGGNVAHKEG